MMQVLRNNTQIIIWILVIAFVGTIIFAWGMDIGGGNVGGMATNVVGKVNGREIPLQNFGALAEQFIDQERQRTPDKDFTESDYRNARRQAWNEFVNSYLQQDQIEKLGITLTDAEVVDFIRRFPPQEVQQIEVFQTNGQFDYNKYLSAMGDPQYAELWRQVEALVKPRLTTFKLQEYVTSMVRVSDGELQEQYLRDNERIRVDYALVPYSKFPVGANEIDSNEVRSYYNDNPDEFREAEQVYYTTYRLSKEASTEDFAAALEKANQVKKLLDEGGDFATLANEYTEDPSGKGKGGALGYFARGAMVREFDSAAFAMSDGDISVPVKTRFGYHIIYRTGQRKTNELEEVEASHILFRPEMSEGTVQSLEAKMMRLKSEGNATNAETLAKELGITQETQRKVGRDQPIGSFGKDAMLEKFLFEASDGSFSELIDRSEAFYLVRKDRLKPAGLAAFEDVYPIITRKLIDKRQRQLTLAVAQRIHSSVMAGSSLADAAKAAGHEVVESGFFARSGRLPGMGNDATLIGTAFSLSEGKRFSQPVLTNNGAAVIEFKERTAASLDGFAAERDTLRTKALQTAQSAFWDKWFTELINKAEIEDNRKVIFGETM